jgi:mannose-6-phosphate isomerase
VVNDETSAAIAIVTSGSVMAEVGGTRHRFGTYDKFFVPAGLGPLTLTPVSDRAEILQCLPPV